MRLFFSSLYYGFAMYLPRSSTPLKIGQFSKKIRHLACKGMFQQCGKDVNIERKAIFGTGNKISVGDYSGIGINCIITGGPVVIGNNVMMGPDVKIIRTSHEFNKIDIPMQLQGFKDEIPLEICDDVWIGANSIILPGCQQIGKGSIIGAGSIVTKNVEKMAIVGGNPAKILKFRKNI